MASKKRRKNIQFTILVTVIVVLSLSLIIFSSSGGSSSGGCCSGCSCGGCCGGCCGDNEVEDTQLDGTEKQEDEIAAPAPVHKKITTICETKNLASTKVDGSFKQTNYSDHYEYTYSFTIFACKQTVHYKAELDGLKRITVESGTVPINSSDAKSQTYSSKNVKNFENDDVFNRMILSLTDTSIGQNGVFYYYEK